MVSFHFFYSDDTSGHRHVYFHKGTFESIPSDGPWPKPKVETWVKDKDREYHTLYHTFYFPLRSAEHDCPWFIDGEWNCANDHPKGFSRFRDDRRRGWHITLDETRYAIVRGLFRGETVVPIDAVPHRSADLRARFLCDRLNAEPYSRHWFDENAICQKCDDPSKLGIIDLGAGFTDAEICDKWAAHQRWIESTGVNRPFLIGNHDAANPIMERSASQAWKRELVRRCLLAKDAENSGLAIQMNDACADDV